VQYGVSGLMPEGILHLMIGEATPRDIALASNPDAASRVVNTALPTLLEHCLNDFDRIPALPYTNANTSRALPQRLRSNTCAALYE